jgi:5'-nucleotidase
MPFDVDLLKIEIPTGATPNTKCVLTKQDRLAYYSTEFDPRDDPYQGITQMHSRPSKGSFSAPGTDAHALSQGWVSVTPLSLDLTSRVDLRELDELLGGLDKSNANTH